MLRKCCLLLTPGLVSYQAGLHLQQAAWQQVQQGDYDGILLLLQHTPVITLGRNGGKENLLHNPAAYRQQGIDIIEAERGGNITCHNPGQLVGYPVLNLRRWKMDVHWYIHAVEEVLIASLCRVGLQSGRKARYTGVWLANAKIAAIGIALRRWITFHGFALNVSNQLELFSQIVPCGIREFSVTSLAYAGVETSVTEMGKVVAEEFSRLFQCELITQEVTRNDG